MVGGEAKAFIHLVFIPNDRKSFCPLPERVQEFEIKQSEKKDLKTKYTKQRVEGLTAAQMKEELKTLGLRSPENTKASMQDVLLRVGRSGSRENELRCRDCGRPDLGGPRQVPTGDARGTSEYLSQNLGVYISEGDLWNEDGKAVCEMTIDEAATRTCPDYGKMEFKMNPRDRVLLWDSAPSHLPNGPGKISPFETFVQEKLNLKGVAYSPPYSPWVNPIEYFWAHNKQKVRHVAPKTQDELWQAIKTAADSVTGKMIRNWFKLAGFDVGLPKFIPVDPNEGKANRCNLPADAKFLRREHVVCVDRKGVVRREKLPRHTTWSQYDKKRRLLQEVSVVKKAGVPRADFKIDNCQPPDDGGKTRWVGIKRPAPAGLEFRDYEEAGLFRDDEDTYAIEAIIGERGEDSSKEFLVRWMGYDESHDSWLGEDSFSVGFQSLLRDWQARNKREAKRKQVQDSKRNSKLVYKPNRQPKVGDTVVLKAPRSASTQFYVAKVLSLEADGTGTVHWYDAKSIDNTWSLQFLAQKGKGTAGPYVQSLDIMLSVIDTAPELQNKKSGKLEQKHIDHILELINE